MILEDIADQMENILDEQISENERIFEQQQSKDRTVSNKEEL